MNPLGETWSRRRDPPSSPRGPGAPRWLSCRWLSLRWLSLRWLERLRPAGRSTASRLGARALWAPASLALGLGCASTPTFDPVGVDRGRVGASYEIEVAEKNWGDAKVWSSGTPHEEEEAELLDFQLRVRNDSDEPLVLNLDRTELEVSTRGREQLVSRTRPRIDGPREVPPRSTGRIRLTFPLPGQIAPKDIETLELAWVIDTPAGPFTESTAFTREEQSDGPRPRFVYSSWYPWYPYGRFGPAHPLWW